MKKRILPLFAILSVCSILLTGCTNQKPSAPASEIETETVTEYESLATRELTINIANMCGTDIGMFSIIDPVTGEQRNLDSLQDKEVISITADWPDTVTEFQWALYNKNGELCSEGNTDISGASKSVMMVLNGNGDFESVDTTLE